MLLYYTFKGRKWAKNIMIVLSSIAIFVVPILCINLIHATMHPVMYIIMYIVFTITLALNPGLIYIVAFSSSFKEYLKSLNI